MNDTSQQTPNRPGRRPLKPLVWLGLLAVAAFLILLIFLPVYREERGLNLLFLSAIGGVVVALAASATALLAKWLFPWHNLRRGFFALACVVTLVALFYAVENWRGRHAWLEHRKQLEAKGEVFSIPELVPPPVPDEENFAMTPLLAPVLAFTNGPTGVVWPDTNGLARLSQISHELAPDVYWNKRVMYGDIEKGTFADLAATSEYYRGNTNYPQASPSATPAEVILVALSRFEPELEELQRAAATRPKARFPIHYEQEPALAILLPHLAHVKRLSALVHLRAVAELELGRSEKAFSDLLLGLRLSDSIHQEPILIDHLVRIASLSFQLLTLREALVRHAWSDAQLAELERRLASINLLAEYQNALRGERVLATASIDYVRRFRFKVNLPDYLGDERADPGVNLGFKLMPSGWYYRNMLLVSEIHQQYTLAAVDERARRVFPEIAKEQSKRVEEIGRGPCTILARMLLPALTKAVERTARAQTWVDAARVSCALERYRLEYGKLPDSLNALVPAYLPGLPLDVIDGKPLRWQVEADGSYKVYSVGWNQVDDQGELVFRGPKRPDASVDPEKGDWVWEMPAE